MWRDKRTQKEWDRPLQISILTSSLISNIRFKLFIRFVRSHADYQCVLKIVRYCCLLWPLRMLTPIFGLLIYTNTNRRVNTNLSIRIRRWKAGHLSRYCCYSPYSCDFVCWFVCSVVRPFVRFVRNFSFLFCNSLYLLFVHLLLISKQKTKQ